MSSSEGGNLEVTKLLGADLLQCYLFFFFFLMKSHTPGKGMSLDFVRSIGWEKNFLYFLVPFILGPQSILQIFTTLILQLP